MGTVSQIFAGLIPLVDPACWPGQKWVEVILQHFTTVVSSDFRLNVRWNTERKPAEEASIDAIEITAARIKNETVR